MAGATAPPPTFADIAAAARFLRGHVVVTPLLRSAALDAATGGTVLIKAECLQVSGSFKYRGALWAVSRLAPDARARGVVAYSSGNHARAVALAARRFGCAATIVMPADAPHAKLGGTRAAGAELVLYDRATQSREAIAEDIARQTGGALVLPFDHPHTIAGQGTAGNEIADQCRALGLWPDLALVPCSGGGLAAGIALALEEKVPGTAVWAVEPKGFDDHARSLAAGRRETNAPGAATICDALMAPGPGALTFEINRARLAGALAVSDAEVRAAMRFAFDELKLVVEPGGAVALAALLAGRVDLSGRTAVAVCSGGNVDRAQFAEALFAEALAAGA